MRQLTDFEGTANEKRARIGRKYDYVRQLVNHSERAFNCPQRHPGSATLHAATAIYELQQLMKLITAESDARARARLQQLRQERLVMGRAGETAISSRTGGSQAVG